MRTPRATIALALLLLAPAAAQASHVPGAPRNDDYLQSFSLNSPGERLEREATLRDLRSTVNASVQSNIFSPAVDGGPGQPGPAELTTCTGGSLGKTVWYDFYPDVPGIVRLRANGFNTGIAAMPFDTGSGRPDYGRRQCFNESPSTTEEFLARVAKGRAYTIQVGGIGNIGGNLEFLFDFLADTDGDGVLDDVDRCDRLQGPSDEAGCPPRLRADVTLRARPTANGIQLVALRVRATRGSRVSVRCSGCRPQAKKARTVSFGRLRGRTLRSGQSLVIRVTKRRSIGSYFKYRISRGNFRKIERCLNPGSKRPRRKCG